MPSSKLQLAHRVVHMVHQVRPHASILDVGPGWGKYGVLLREYLDGIERLEAVEAWEPYVTPMLRAIYDKVWTDDVLAFSPSSLAQYDVVLMVDVIEHMEKGDALALLARIPGTVVICTPVEFFQNPEADEIPPERHRSVWSVQEFKQLGADKAFEELGGVLARLPNGRRR